MKQSMNNELMPKFFSFLSYSQYKQKGVINPIVIGGVIVLGIIVFLAASGSFKFSASIKTDDQAQKQVEPESSEPQSTPTLSPTPEPAPAVKLNSEPFSDSKLKFSISYPEGWQVKQQSTSVNFYLQSKTKANGGADALLTISSVSAGEYKDTKLSTIGDLHKVQIKKNFGEVNFTGEKDSKVAGLDAYEMEFTGTLSGESVKAKYYIVSYSSYLYSLIAIASDKTWDANQDVFKASLDTFKPE